MPAAELLDAVAAIAAEAGALALGRWRGDFRQWDKGADSPVCEVDLAVDALLRARLGILLPNAGWLSEETADSPERLAKRRVWIVDPIDGTRDFIRGRDGWCVSIALVEEGQAVLGVLDAPARGQRWRATLGGGAWRGGERLRVSPRDELAGARLSAESLARADRLFTPVAKPNSIALRLAMVASGEADLLATQRWGHEWNIAAATIIAAESGATLTDALGAPLRFNKPDPRDFGILAASPTLHAKAERHFSSRARLLAHR